MNRSSILFDNLCPCESQYKVAALRYVIGAPSLLLEHYVAYVIHHSSHHFPCDIVDWTPRPAEHDSKVVGGYA